MATFLFWNIGRKNPLLEVAAITLENDADVLILAESGVNETELIQELNRHNDRIYRVPPLDFSPRLKFFVRYSHDSFQSLFDEGGIALRRIRPPVGKEILLVAVHLPSKMYRKEHEQTILATELARIIRAKEEEIGHQNTIVIGDLNMDPFEHGVIAAHGIHAVSDKNVVRRQSRTVDGAVLPFFYNPMWNHLGDYNSSPPGTFYYGTGEVCHFWHMFDQVLLRPNLVDVFSMADLKILTQANGRSLMRGNRIDTTIADHLPISVTLDLERLA